MNLWAIFVVYASLATPVKVIIPPSTIAVESNAECVQVAKDLFAKHSLDMKGYRLIYAGCERVEPLYNQTGVKL